MPMYKCRRTFTSLTSHKMYGIGQQINQHSYDMLRYSERDNFELDKSCEYTPPPVFNPSTLDTLVINHTTTHT